MRPKEIKERLGIDANRIKLFKREGIFAPENPPSGNRGTNYTDVDFENLRLIVVLTKSGLTCSEIRKLQDGDWTLNEAIEARKKNIDADIVRKRNSLELLVELQKDKADFETFDTDRYWAIIKRREAAGEEFMDVEDLYGYQPVSLIRDVECPYCHEKQEVDLEDFLWDQSSFEKENGMGPDIVYSFDSEDNYVCPACHKGLQITGWAREYPVGVFDSDEVEALPLEEEED